MLVGHIYVQIYILVHIHIHTYKYRAVNKVYISENYEVDLFTITVPLHKFILRVCESERRALLSPLLLNEVFK
jgi:hypothetical protein